MLVCCGNGKPISEMDALDRLACNHDHCIGPIEEYLYKAFSGYTEEILAELKKLTEENT